MRVADPWGRPVVMTRARWTGHVVPKHPELAAHVDPVAAAVEAPTMVCRDRLHPNRDVFYRPAMSAEPLDGLLVRVVVAFNGQGRIVTAHLIKQPHHQERQKWP